jgi:hypothetical protein
MRPPERIPLGHLLALVNYLPDLCPTGPKGVYHALCYLSQLPLRDVGHVTAVWPLCRASVMSQHPNLEGITLPYEQLRKNNWAYVWAWLDTQERRRGVEVSVRPVTEPEWRRFGYREVPRAVSSQGLPVRLIFSDPPLEFL